jgi:proteic killer suppression protein
MIKTWNDEDTRVLFERGKSRKIAQNIQKVALRKLVMIDQATSLDDIGSAPGNNLKQHKFQKHAGKWSIKVNDQWRIVFDWRDGNAYEVEITDYH